MGAQKKSFLNGTEGRSGLLPFLKERQREMSGLDRKTMEEAAVVFGLTLNEVYATATFYSYLSTEPKGRHVIRVCACFPCDMKDGGAVRDAIVDATGVQPGETSPDGRFSLEIVNCIGACDRAPAIMVDDDLHGHLSPGDISGIFEKYT